jgi:hypothetical protein
MAIIMNITASIYDMPFYGKVKVEFARRYPPYLKAYIKEKRSNTMGIINKIKEKLKKSNKKGNKQVTESR